MKFGVNAWVWTSPVTTDESAMPNQMTFEYAHAHLATPMREDNEPVETVLELLERVESRRDLALVLAQIWELSPLQQECVRGAYLARQQELEAGYER